MTTFTRQRFIGASILALVIGSIFCLPSPAAAQAGQPSATLTRLWAPESSPRSVRLFDVVALKDEQSEWRLLLTLRGNPPSAFNDPSLSVPGRGTTRALATVFVDTIKARRH